MSTTTVIIILQHQPVCTSVIRIESQPDNNISPSNMNITYYVHDFNTAQPKNGSGIQETPEGERGQSKLVFGS